MVAIAIAALGAALLYLGMVLPILSLLRRAPTSTADAPTPPLAVESSKLAPMTPAEVLSNPPAVVSPGSALESPSSGPLTAPPPRMSKSIRKFAGRQFAAAVDGLAARLANCPDRYVHRGFGTSPVDQGGDQFTMLVLDVAMHDGKMEIIDVSPESNGSVSAALVACAQKTLRAQVVPAPAAREASRTQYAIFLGPAMSEFQGQPDIANR
jgi:hypothetical protein